MIDFKSIDFDERQLYRKQILLSFERLDINANENDEESLFDRVIQTNKSNENCQNYKQALNEEFIFFEKINFKNCTNRNDVLYKNNLL